VWLLSLVARDFAERKAQDGGVNLVYITGEVESRKAHLDDPRTVPLSNVKPDEGTGSMNVDGGVHDRGDFLVVERDLGSAWLSVACDANQGHDGLL
jgi:hypothetical protein